MEVSIQCACNGMAYRMPLVTVNFGSEDYEEQPTILCELRIAEKCGHTETQTVMSYTSKKELLKLAKAICVYYGRSIRVRMPQDARKRGRR